MRVLLIDNTRDPDSWGSEELRRALSLPGGVAAGIELHTVRAPHADLPRSERIRQFDRIVLSGSATSVTEDAPWIESLLALIRAALDRRTPLLGVCYGHQSLARALGGKSAVARASAPEIGWTRIRKLGAGSPIFTGIPDEFHSFSMHYDEVCELPPGTQLLASSDLCRVQAFAVNGAPAFGVQFHPERDLDGAAQTFASKRKLRPAPPLLNAGRADLHDPDIASTLIRNFYALGREENL